MARSFSQPPPTATHRKTGGGVCPWPPGAVGRPVGRRSPPRSAADRFTLVSAPFWGETPPATPVPPAHAEQMVREVFGIDGTATPLSSNQETNLRIRTGRR